MGRIDEQSEYAHSATALVNVTAAQAFGFLADPLSLGTWSLGCLAVQPSKSGGGPYSGVSLFDDSRAWFEIEAHEKLLMIDYLVGAPESLKPRISARVVPAAAVDLQPSQCYVTLLAWRPAQMSDERWSQLCASHEAEIWIIKARLETIATAKR